MSENFDKMGLRICNPENIEQIQWTKNFELKMEHFKKENGAEGSLVVSIISEYNISLLGKQIDKYEIINLKVKSLFRPKDAHIDREIWPKKDNNKTLLFYQGSFDLAEEIARKSQTELEKKIFRKYFSCKGRGKSERRKFAQEETQRQIIKLMTPFVKEFFIEQIEYEKNVGNPEKFEKNYSKYKTRFDKLREEIFN